MFNEPEWLKLLFLLSDTQSWIDDMNKELFHQLPICKKKFINKQYYLTVQALAHIIERHYYKINRYPHASKFNIPVIEILQLIREAHSLLPMPAPGSNNFQRTLQAENNIGYDKSGQATNIVTILTDGGGKIITVFPGINQTFCFERE